MSDPSKIIPFARPFLKARSLSDFPRFVAERGRSAPGLQPLTTKPIPLAPKKLNDAVDH